MTRPSPGVRASPPPPSPESPVQRLATLWSQRTSGTPSPDELRAARSLSPVTEYHLEALFGVAASRHGGADALAEAYERLALVMLDTLQRRAALGQAGALAVLATLDQILSEKGRAVDVRPLFENLKRKARGDAESPDLERLRGRIQGLRDKTVARGCTEEEALAAAEKVAELLDRYGLSLSETELRQQVCQGVGIDTGRKRRGPLDDCLPTIADFCDCRCWSEIGADGLIRHVFFGIPSDVAGAHYLYDLIGATIESQLAVFRTSDLYRDHPSGQRASASRSFQIGMTVGILGKLADLKRSRSTGKGRALVPVKDAAIDEDLEKLGLSFQMSNRPAKRQVLVEAFSAGRAAGAEFEVRPGLAGPTRSQA